MMVIGKLHLRIVLALYTVLLFISPVRAQIGFQPGSFEFKPPPGRETPQEGTASGGSRPVNSGCFNSGQKSLLTALVPGSYVGLTQSNQPELIVYQPPTNAQTAELSIFDRQGEGIYQTHVPADSNGGLVRVRLPKNIPDLVTNKSYYWTFALICRESDRTEDVVVGGWMEIAPMNANLRSQLVQASPQQKISLLAQHGYWYDAIVELLNMQNASLDNPIVVKMWEDLLQSVGLDNIAQKPIDELRLVTTRKYRGTK